MKSTIIEPHILKRIIDQGFTYALKVLDNVYIYKFVGMSVIQTDEITIKIEPAIEYISPLDMGYLFRLETGIWFHTIDFIQFNSKIGPAQAPEEDWIKFKIFD